MCLLLASLWGNKEEWHKMAVTDSLLKCGLVLVLLDHVSQRNFASDSSWNIHTTHLMPCIVLVATSTGVIV
jgi:hypothetical protein